MADQHLRFSYDSNEEDWDLTTLQFLNSQLESYVNMVGYKKRYIYFGTDVTLDFICVSTPDGNGTRPFYKCKYMVNTKNSCNFSCSIIFGDN